MPRQCRLILAAPLASPRIDQPRKDWKKDRVYLDDLTFATNVYRPSKKNSF